MENKKLLPLGSIVYLKDGNKKLMIAARGLITKNGDGFVFFDYGGVPYPEGIVDTQVAYFQHESVTKVVFEGFSDDDDEATVAKILSYAEAHPDIPRGDVEKMLAELD